MLIFIRLIFANFNNELNIKLKCFYNLCFVDLAISATSWDPNTVLCISQTSKVGNVSFQYIRFRHLSAMWLVVRSIIYVSHSSWPSVCKRISLRSCVNVLAPLSLSSLSVFVVFVNQWWMDDDDDDGGGVRHLHMFGRTHRSGFRIAHEIFRSFFWPFLWLDRYVGCRIDFHKLFGLVKFSHTSRAKKWLAMLESKMCRICCVSALFMVFPPHFHCSRILVNGVNSLDHFNRRLWKMSIGFVFPTIFWIRKKLRP